MGFKHGTPKSGEPTSIKDFLVSDKMPIAHIIEDYGDHWDWIEPPTLEYPTNKLALPAPRH